MASLKDLMLKCNRCGHQWLRRTAEGPRQCPRCKNLYWNQKRVRKLKPERRAKKR